MVVGPVFVDDVFLQESIVITKEAIQYCHDTQAQESKAEQGAAPAGES